MTFRAKYKGINTLSFTIGFAYPEGRKCEDDTKIHMISSEEKGLKKYKFKFDDVMSASTLDILNVQTVINYPNVKRSKMLKDY